MRYLPTPRKKTWRQGGVLSPPATDRFVYSIKIRSRADT